VRAINSSSPFSKFNFLLIKKKTNKINKDTITAISHLFLKDDSSQREVGDADDRDASAAGPSIPSSSNSGTSDPVLLTNLALDSASQPNEAPNTAAPLIPTCSNLGALDAMLQSNLDLVSASQPNETPNTARESSNQLLSIY
jgi:hypothetical protein